MLILPHVCLFALFAIESMASDTMLLSDFSSSNYREMRTVDDPVMGGSSVSTFSIKDNDCLVWEGVVKIVSFLEAPGFCILETARRQSFVGLGRTSGISFIVKTKGSNQEVNMLEPMAAQVTTGAKSRYGYRVTYVGNLAEKELEGGLVELYAPWSSFKASFRGQEVDAPPLTADELEKTYRVGLSTYASHKAGEFHVELVKIEATLIDTNLHL